MSYSVDLRERVVGYVRSGVSPNVAAKIFKVGRSTIYRWLVAPDLSPRPAEERKRKLDKSALAAHVRDFPDLLLRERAVYFGVIWSALKKLKITKKRRNILRVITNKEYITYVNYAIGSARTAGRMLFILMRAALRRPLIGLTAGLSGDTRSLIKSRGDTKGEQTLSWLSLPMIGSL